MIRRLLCAMFGHHYESKRVFNRSMQICQRCFHVRRFSER